MDEWEKEWHEKKVSIEFACMGYAIMAAEKSGFTEEQIITLQHAIHVFLFERMNTEHKRKIPPAEAQKAYYKWLKKTRKKE